MEFENIKSKKDVDKHIKNTLESLFGIKIDKVSDISRMKPQLTSVSFHSSLEFIELSCILREYCKTKKIELFFTLSVDYSDHELDIKNIKKQQRKFFNILKKNFENNKSVQQFLVEDKVFNGSYFDFDFSFTIDIDFNFLLFMKSIIKDNEGINNEKLIDTYSKINDILLEHNINDFYLVPISEYFQNDTFLIEDFKTFIELNYKK